MPADVTPLPTLGNHESTQIFFKYDETHAQLVILQNAFKCVLSCSELRESDPPMLDVLDALTERFRDLLQT